ncbi:lipid IV(A) 3-deoxy-D-manno-octulosonic acid transferase [Thalassotalea euphylliae]|uniref:3-deoxy-D-manno-octulosonic acid transferase n=1 Tax=Thalassotalea euphylliae TaxID=1655234 RepID=A0A3E0U5C0_9GAMM|nr:lipid IV(A) 3-deoxy-D-manno-octulosonic acid transferase [Thalassotalea euphylliae]REL31162.1 3-deoxy-D-manno-octulosonic acid transferase [Thalassotalea euphylliae]
MALLTYRLLLIFLLPVVLLAAILRSLSQPAYRQRLHERLGIVPNKFRSGGIVIHGASVGEVLALKPFINQCLAEFPNLPITVTTFTPTGSEQVQKIFGDRVQHCYLPLDVWPCTTMFLTKLKPKALVVMETELWPNLVAQAHKLNTKLLLINGRISDKSVTSYQKFSALIKPCLAKFDQVLAQSEANKERLIALGARQAHCHNIGNLKYDISEGSDTKVKYQTLSPMFPQARPVWLLASSHEGDEQLVLDAYRKAREAHSELLLVIVPRHPERFDKVAQLLAQEGFSYQRRSNAQPIMSETQVWLMDSLGELLAAYQLANIVTIGGTFSTIGGHNPLEPALYQKPTIVGSDMANFAEVHQQLVQQNGIITLAHQDNKQQLALQLSQQVRQLLVNNTQAQTLGSNAYQVVKANQGCSERTLAALKTELS